MQSRHAPEVKSRRGIASSLLSCLFGNSGAEGQSSCLLLMVAIGLVLNVAVCAMLLTGTFRSSSSSAATTVTTLPADGTAQTLSLAAAAGSASPLEAQLRADLATWQASHRTVTGQFEALSQQYTELTTTHKKLRDMLATAQEAAAANPNTNAAGCSAEDKERMRKLEKQLREAQEQVESLETKLAAASASGPGGNCPPCIGGLDHSRLKKTDLTLSKFDFASHEKTLSCAASKPVAQNESLTWCPETATNEQYYQLQFFDRPGAGSRAAVRKPKPAFPKCVQLPPEGYKFPPKVQSMPLAPGDTAVHWPNLRVQKLEDLLVFNMGTPKNLYHFNASFYDYEQEAILDASAAVIPWGHKVRLMLDVGSGGASLGMLAKRRYDVQVVSTVFADWPYCEYITERGQICMYVDAMEAMPFAKFSYDVIHSSWVFHALFTHQLRTAYLEQHRLLRPGGYLWIYGGWSFAQVDTIMHLLVDQLGYTLLYEKRLVVDTTKVKHAFDTIPFELEWTAILLKPIRADDTCVRVLTEEKKRQ
jgi:SAM-dependent methyltransferase